MKARFALRIGALQVIVGILSLSWVSAQTPYPPSGYRPSGRQFGLPNRPTNQYGPPSRSPPNQYEAPANRPQVTVTPPNQYLPSLDPTYFRSNFGGQQPDFLNQGEQPNVQQNFDQQQTDGRRQQQGYLRQEEQRQGSLDQNQQTQQQVNGRQTYIRQQVNQRGQTSEQQNQQGWAQDTYAPNNDNNQNLNFDQNQQQLNGRQTYIRQEVNQRGQTSEQQNQQGWAQNTYALTNDNQNFRREQVAPSRQNSGTSSLNRNYLTPQRNTNQNQNFGQQSAKQLYESSGQDEDNFADNEEDVGGNEEQIPATKDINVAGQNYLPPTTTEGYINKPTKRRRYPEPTTRRPETQEPIEPESEPEDPNVAIATAVARGQYYLLQPDGRLQRVTYKTTQTQEDLKDNGYSAKLIYQNVEPITAPIFTYAAPLVSPKYL